MSIIGYRFADGTRFQAGAKAEDADRIGRHIEHLRQQQKGELTPRDIVDDAKNPRSPLHSFFEWDDSMAAEQHRLHQARGLIRAVVAIYKEPDQRSREVRAFVHIPEPGAPHYREVGHAMSMEKTRQLVLKRAWREFQAWRSKYAQLAEFAALFAAADKVAKGLPRPDDDQAA